MNTVTSKDGTQIAYEKLGEGPAVILVGGALSTSEFGPSELAELLAEHFTTYSYDRRGRGDSGDTQPYAVAREIEDIDALIDLAGGSAYLYGHSSGAALAFEATLALGSKVGKLAMYEAPYNVDDAALEKWKEFGKQLAEFLETGRRGKSVVLFMKLVGMPNEQIGEMIKSPVWPIFESVAPTLMYDYKIIGDEKVPTERAQSITVPTLVMNGSESYDFMLDVAKSLSSAIPNAKMQTLEGQTHNVEPDILAPVLAEFFGE